MSPAIGLESVRTDQDRSQEDKKGTDGQRGAGMASIATGGDMDRIGIFW